MTDPVGRRFNATEYLKSMGPITGTPVQGKVSTTQTAADLASVRSVFAANDKLQAETTAELKRISAPRVNDVATMSPEEAQSRLTQLKALESVGGLGRIGVNAVSGDQKTTSMSTYIGWLTERADEQPAATNFAPPPLFDVTA